MSAGVEFLTAVSTPETLRSRPWPGTLWSMAVADFHARTRQPGHLVALLVMAWLTNGMLPPQGSGYRTFTMINGYRPAYGPEWVGVLVAMLTSVYFMLVGFYLVRGGVQRDSHNGVGQILAATRMSKLGYLASKALSNCLVFASMMGVAMLVALISQQLLAEDRRIDILATWLPFLLLTGPVALFVSCAAVCFDCLPVLRGGIGNVVWFFLFGAVLGSSSMDTPSDGRSVMDLVGGRAVSDRAFTDMQQEFPAVRVEDRSLSMGVNVSPEWKGKRAQTFPWHGMQWTRSFLLVRLFWCGIALMLLVFAATVFDRFERGTATHAPGRSSLFGRFERLLHGLAPSTAPAVVRASTLTVAPRTFAFLNLLGAEGTLLAKGLPVWWYLGAIGFLIAGIFAPTEHLKSGWLPVASFWPVFAWSTLGTREKQFDTAGLFFSVARPVQRMLPAAWLAGALLMLVIGSTGMLRLALAGETQAVAGWVLGAFGVSALALALGIWTGSGKFFEVFYLFLWYIGPMHHLPEFDYTGVTATRSHALWVVYSVIVVTLFIAAWVGRTRQIRR